MAAEPKTLLGVAEAGVRKVAPVFIVGFLLSGLGLWLWPRPEGGARQPQESDIALQVLRDNPDGGRPVTATGPLRLGERVRLAADVPFLGTVAVFDLVDGGAARLWPAAAVEPARTSAGKRVELLGDLKIDGAPGERRWLLSLCPLGADALSCTVLAHGETQCPDGCGVARLESRVEP